MSDPQDILDAAAAAPASATIDGQTVTQHPLRDVQAYVRSKQAEAGSGFGVRFASMIPGGHR
jgi:hypothetical protein